MLGITLEGKKEIIDIWIGEKRGEIRNSLKYVS